MQGPHEKIWQKALVIIKDNLDEKSFSTWFLPIKPLSYKNQVLIVQVPSFFFYEYLEENYLPLLKKTLNLVTKVQPRLSYKVVVDNSTKNTKKSTIQLPSNNVQNVKNKPVDFKSSNTPMNPFVIPGIQKLNIESNLKENLSFDNFIEGNCNRFGRGTGLTLAKNPGVTSFNPLFLHGVSGVGKTHIANAIGLKVKELHSDKIVLYVSAHDFQTRYTDAVRNNSVIDFVNFFRLIDVFIVDDVQDFIGKEATQKVFFNIFNFLHQQGKQLILTSDRPPAELEGFSDRLLTRFKWGVNAELLMPDYETRLKILKFTAYQTGMEVSDKVLELIAKSVTTSIRELVGVLYSVTAHSAVDACKITLELTKKVLKSIVKERTPNFTDEQIIKIVADYFQIPPKSIKAKTRKREVVQARHIAIYFMKKLTNMSSTAIGNTFNRDHSTVLHALKAVSDLSETNKDFKNYMSDLERTFKY